MFKKVSKIAFNILFIAFIFYIILHDHYYEIVESLKNISFFQGAFLLGCGLIFFILDGFAHYQVIRHYVSEHRFKCSIELVALNNFFNATTSSVGTIPFQSYYLKKNNIPYSKGISSMFLNMIFHKIAVLFNAIAVTLFQFRWLFSNQALHKYIYLGFFLNIVIIIVLILFVFWNKTERIFNKIMDWIPASFNKMAAKDEMFALARGAREQMKNSKMMAQIFLAHLLKVCWLCLIPYFCIQVVSDVSLSFSQIYTLSSLAYIIASSLPNVAGIGPLEYAYIILFSFYVTAPVPSTSLILYRTSSFYFLFVISAFMFMKIKNELFHEKISLTKI